MAMKRIVKGERLSENRVRFGLEDGRSVEVTVGSREDGVLGAIHDLRGELTEEMIRRLGFG